MYGGELSNLNLICSSRTVYVPILINSLRHALITMQHFWTVVVDKIVYPLCREKIYNEHTLLVLQHKGVARMFGRGSAIRNEATDSAIFLREWAAKAFN